MENSVKRIGIYGLGRFGRFWAGQLSALHPVLAWSRNSGHQPPDGVQRADEEEVLDCEVLVFCVAISSLEEVLKRISGRLRPHTLVMDTCSVKVYPSRLMQTLLPEKNEILATHPMLGPDSGASGLDGMPMVYCPLRMSEESSRLWRENFQSLGLNVIQMSPEDHDRQAATTQGITHFIGRVLGELNLTDTPISTTGYKRLLDIVDQTCKDPWQLFVDLQRYNPYTAPMRNDLRHAIMDMLDKFEHLDED